MRHRLEEVGLDLLDRFRHLNLSGNLRQNDKISEL